jgi:hypothetical protein
MSKSCANCGASQGPFTSIRLFFDTVWVCKNIKSAQDRITECVKRRDKIDYDKYKETIEF